MRGKGAEPKEWMGTPSSPKLEPQVMCSSGLRDLGNRADLDSILPLLSFEDHQEKDLCVVPCPPNDLAILDLNLALIPCQKPRLALDLNAWPEEEYDQAELAGPISTGDPLPVWQSCKAEQHRAIKESPPIDIPIKELVSSAPSKGKEPSKEYNTSNLPGASWAKGGTKGDGQSSAVITFNAAAGPPLSRNRKGSGKLVESHPRRQTQPKGVRLGQSGSHRERRLNTENWNLSRRADSMESFMLWEQP